MVLATDLSIAPRSTLVWSGLADDPLQILDFEATREAMSAAARAVNGGAVREAGVAVLRAANEQARDWIASNVARRPREADKAVHDYSWLTDQVVRLTLDFALQHLHPLSNPTASERIAAVAVGGCGRGEMAPFSDVDLLFLTPYKQTAWGESLIESVLYCLWDLRLKVGHSVRTIDDCLRLAREDVTIRTSLLENRLLWGDATLGSMLNDRLRAELFASTGPEFIELKLAERAQRHRRQGSSRYLLEPNVKEGKGGLRDLQTLFWIAEYLSESRSPLDLLGRGFFSPEEYSIFTDAAQFLWMTRVHMHLLTGRATEQLTFDLQVELAAVLGFEATEGQQAVERFMQTYFTHAKHVGDLTRIFLAGLEARHVKARPKLSRAIRNVFAFGRDPTAEGYRLNNGRLDIVDYDAFLKDPLNILRLFRERLRGRVMIHPDALRLVAANLDLIDDAMRADPEANRIFLECLLDHQNPEKALRLMNEVGVLGRFIPEFGRIVAMMQFNMYHHYTVDEHIIQTIATLSHIERGNLRSELPVASAIASQGISRRVLYVALLLHDVGKGSGRDHSEFGAEIAERLCPRLGLEPEESEQVAWLVRHHLLMSDVAQKRDLSDPRTVRDFGLAVKSSNRLKLLTVLTVCDIRGVGPGVWNNWKAMLLRTLYRETLDYLTGGAQARGRSEREAEAKAELAAVLEGWSETEIRAECERHYPPYWLGFDTETHRRFADLVRRLERDGASIQSSIELDFGRDATQACFAMADHPGLFARLAGALALAGANVVDARTYTTTDGIATAAFWVQDAEGAPYEKSRLARLRQSVMRTLAGEIVARDELRNRHRVKKREQGFKVPTQISFDNSGSDIYTIIEIETRDRLGLVHDIARTLTANNISIASAIIATYGEQAVDVFYVKDIFGLKIHSEAKRRALEAKLRRSILRNTGDGTA